MDDDFPTPVNEATLGGHFKPSAEKGFSQEALNALSEGPNQMVPEQYSIEWCVNKLCSEDDFPIDGGKINSMPEFLMAAGDIADRNVFQEIETDEQRELAAMELLSPALR